MEKVQKVISNSGFCSRRQAEELIKQNKVKVNGELATIGMRVKQSDIIEINGKIINKNDSKVYFLLNKPRGVVTTSSDELGRKTVVDLINTNKRIYPVGRLDYDTTGVLLLTNDGELTNKLTHPKNNVDKVYIAKIEGIINGTDINKLKQGVQIDNYVTSPARVKLRSINKKTKTSIVEITIHEGHNHQVKNMFESIGYKVIKLNLSDSNVNFKDIACGLLHNKVKQVFGVRFLFFVTS